MIEKRVAGNLRPFSNLHPKYWPFYVLMRVKCNAFFKVKVFGVWS